MHAISCQNELVASNLNLHLHCTSCSWLATLMSHSFDSSCTDDKFAAYSDSDAPLQNLVTSLNHHWHHPLD